MVSKKMTNRTMYTKSYTCIDFRENKENNKLGDVVNFFNRSEKYGFLNHTKSFSKYQVFLFKEFYIVTSIFYFVCYLILLSVKHRFYMKN